MVSENDADATTPDVEDPETDEPAGDEPPDFLDDDREILIERLEELQANLALLQHDLEQNQFLVKLASQNMNRLCAQARQVEQMAELVRMALP